MRPKDRIRLIAAAVAVLSMAGCQLTPQAEAARHPQPHIPEEARPFAASRAYQSLCMRVFERNWRSMMAANKNALARLVDSPMLASCQVSADGSIDQVTIAADRPSWAPEVELQGRMFSRTTLPAMPPEVVRETGGRMGFRIWLQAYTQSY